MGIGLGRPSGDRPVIECNSRSPCAVGNKFQRPAKGRSSVFRTAPPPRQIEKAYGNRASRHGRFRTPHVRSPPAQPAGKGEKQPPCRQLSQVRRGNPFHRSRSGHRRPGVPSLRSRGHIRCRCNAAPAGVCVPKSPRFNEIGWRSSKRWCWPRPWNPDGRSPPACQTICLWKAALRP
jgi:hypothetical protein